MRNSPLNYLLTAAVFGLLWIAFGIFVNSWLSGSISFVKLSPEQFSPQYQIMMGSTALIGFIFSAFWYMFGAKKENATIISKANATWTKYFIAEIVISIISFAVFAIIYKGEGISGLHFGVVYLGCAMVSFIPYWICTLIASPKYVEYCPLGKR
jgi:hypothetical protein